MGQAKQSRPGHAEPSAVLVASFEADHQLRPVTCLKVYVARMLTVQAHNSQPFIAMVKPPKPVLLCTIAREF